MQSQSSLSNASLYISIGKMSKEILLGNQKFSSFAQSSPSNSHKIFLEFKDFSQTSCLISPEAKEKIKAQSFPFPHCFIDSQWMQLQTFQEGWSLFDSASSACLDEWQELVRKESEKMDFTKEIVILFDAFDCHSGFACRFIQECIRECFPKVNFQIFICTEGKLNSNVAFSWAFSNQITSKVICVDSELEPLNLASLLSATSPSNASETENELLQRAKEFYENV